MKHKPRTTRSIPVLARALLFLFPCLPAHAELELEPFNPRMHAAGKAHFDYIVTNYMPSEAELGIKSAADFANVVYIDPSVSVAGNGSSPESPLKSWSDVSWVTNTAYLQRRGTEETLPGFLATNQSNIHLGAYGEGPRPILQTFSNQSGDHGTIRMQNRHTITVRDMHVRGPNLTCVVKLGHGNITLYNNRFEDSNYGIRGHSRGTNFRIIGNLIHNIRDDAVFLQFNDREAHPGETEIAWNHFYDLNTAWEYPFTSESVAHGDAIQLEPSHGWHVHHNVMDRSTNSQKFAFISNGGQGYGILEHNYLIGPNGYGSGATVYFGSQQEGFIVRYNIFAYGELSPIYSNSRDLQIYGNIFYKNRGAVSPQGHNAYLHNNVWWDHTSNFVASSGNTRIRNNIFDIRSAGNRIQAFSTLENNLFTATHADIVGRGTGNIIMDDVADLGLVDPDNMDFRPMPGSPVIDTGMTITDFPVQQDRAGTSIPQGTAPDIGIYEFTGTIRSSPPGIPTGLTGEVKGTGIALSWDPVAGADSYRVMRYEGPQRGRYEAFFELDGYESILSNDGMEGLVVIGSPTTNHFTDADTRAGHIHYYVVTAVSDTDGEGLYGPQLIVTFDDVDVPRTEWAGYPIDADGWVETGNWISRIDVLYAPWLYSPALQWIWMEEEHVTETGAWSYVPKPRQTLIISDTGETSPSG